MKIALRAGFLVVCACSCALTTGCDNRRDPPFDPRPPPPVAPTPQLARLLHIDAGELEAPVDPPAPAGDLKTDIDRFTTLDACVAERAHLDPLLGDALEAIGYDTFLRDACRMVDAAKAGDPGRCAAIDSSALAAQCRSTVAQVAGIPDACPWQAASRPARGRDAKCVALAARDVRLCAAAADADRATCEATLARDGRRCLMLRALADQSRCRRDATRWGDVLAEPAGASQRDPTDVDGGRKPPDPKSIAPRTPFTIAGELHVEPAGAVKPGALPFDLDLAPDLARGVVVVEGHDGARVTLGPLSEAGLDFIAPSPFVRGSLAVELLVPTAAPAHGGAASQLTTPVAARVVRAELLLPGHAPMSASPFGEESGSEPGKGPGAGPRVQSALAARVGDFAHVRGSAVAFTVDGDFGVGGSSWHVHAEGTTFVRDVVKTRDLVGDPPGLGDGRGMR
jgi:hypothetical protein